MSISSCLRAEPHSCRGLIAFASAAICQVPFGALSAPSTSQRVASREPGRIRRCSKLAKGPPRKRSSSLSRLGTQSPPGLSAATHTETPLDRRRHKQTNHSANKTKFIVLLRTPLGQLSTAGRARRWLLSRRLGVGIRRAAVRVAGAHNKPTQAADSWPGKVALIGSLRGRLADLADRWRLTSAGSAESVIFHGDDIHTHTERWLFISVRLSIGQEGSRPLSGSVYEKRTTFGFQHWQILLPLFALKLASSVVTVA